MILITGWTMSFGYMSRVEFDVTGTASDRARKNSSVIKTERACLKQLFPLEEYRFPESGWIDLQFFSFQEFLYP